MLWKGIAGVEVGLRDDQVMLHNEQTKENMILSIKGKKIYGTKCERAEQTGGSIFLSQKDRKNCTFVLILARGSGCTQDAKGIRPMRRVSCPDDVPTGIQRSPYNPNEYFIDEDLLQILDETES